jgi:hypothetical protein
MQYRVSDLQNLAANWEPSSEADQDHLLDFLFQTLERIETGLTTHELTAVVSGLLGAMAEATVNNGFDPGDARELAALALRAFDRLG